MDIKVEDVSVSVPHKRIVDTASIYVDEGEFIGLIGPNGSGKSTLLKAVYRTMPKETGAIFLGGDSIDDLSLKESALRLAVVTQHNYYNFDFKVEEVVAMGRTPHKSSMEMDNAEDYKIVLDCLNKVNMLSFKDRVFLDEPTNHLDIKYQLEVLDLVKSLGCTCLCALHDMNLAAQYCDRIYVLKDGKIETSGTPEEVITEQNIENIYGVKSTVQVNKDTGLINVIYHPKHIYKNRKAECKSETTE